MKKTMLAALLSVLLVGVLAAQVAVSKSGPHAAAVVTTSLGRLTSDQNQRTDSTSAAEAHATNSLVTTNTAPSHSALDNSAASTVTSAPVLSGTSGSGAASNPSVLYVTETGTALPTIRCDSNVKCPFLPLAGTE